MKICICGGGNIAHSLAAVLSRANDVSVLTRRPLEWAAHLRCEQGLDHTLLPNGRSVFRTDDRCVLSDAECVIVALPRFVIREVMPSLMDFMRLGQTIVFIPAPAGMETIVGKLSARGIDTIGFQRVPFVARIIEYGKAIWISAVRDIHKLAFSDRKHVAEWKKFFEGSFGGKVECLSSFLSFTFSNSNPLLHPPRLAVLLKGGRNGEYVDCPRFYADWTDESSELYVAADREMFTTFNAYSPEAAKHDYESALAHYGVDNTIALTQKIRSIDSLKPILAPWEKCEGGIWKPDLKSRYFTEDVPYGTEIIQEYADQAGIDTPVIDSLITTIKSWMIKGSNCASEIVNQ